MFLYISLYYYGLTQMSSQEGVIINYLWPIMLVLFACLIEKEPLTFRKAVAMIMSFAGVVVIMSGSAPGEGDHRMAGVLCVVFGGMCFGLYSVLNKRKNYELFFETMVIWATCAVCCFIAGFLTETWVQLSVPALLGVAWSGIFANTVPCLLWALALKDVTNSARIANLAYLVPFLSVILSAVMLCPAITASTMPACTAGIRLSHSCCMISSFQPFASAMALAVITSYPFAYIPGLFAIGTAPLESSGCAQL